MPKQKQQEQEREQDRNEGKQEEQGEPQMKRMEQEVLEIVRNKGPVSARDINREIESRGHKSGASAILTKLRDRGQVQTNDQGMYTA